EGERVPEEDPLQGDDAERGQRLQQRGEHVPLPDHAAVEEREAGHGHEKDEGRTDEDPSGIALVEGSGGHSSSRRQKPPTAEPAAIPRPFCRFCRCSGETKVPTSVTDNIVGNDQKRDKTVCPEK